MEKDEDQSFSSSFDNGRLIKRTHRGLSSSVEPFRISENKETLHSTITRDLSLEMARLRCVGEVKETEMEVVQEEKKAPINVRKRSLCKVDNKNDDLNEKEENYKPFDIQRKIKRDFELHCQAQLEQLFLHQTKLIGKRSSITEGDINDFENSLAPINHAQLSNLHIINQEHNYTFRRKLCKGGKEFIKNLRRRTRRISRFHVERGDGLGRRAMSDLYDTSSHCLAENSHHLYMYLKTFYRFISTNFLPKGTMIQYVSHILNHPIEHEQSETVLSDNNRNISESQLNEEEDRAHYFGEFSSLNSGGRYRSPSESYQESIENQTREILSSSNRYLIEIFQLQPFAAAAFLKMMNYFWLGGFLFLFRSWISFQSNELGYENSFMTCFSAMFRTLLRPLTTTYNTFELQSFFYVWVCAQLFTLLLQVPFRIKLFIYSLEISSSLDVNEANNRVRSLITSKLWTVLQMLSLKFYMVATLGLPLYWSTEEDIYLSKQVVSVCCTNLLVVTLRTFLTFAVIHTILESRSGSINSPSRGNSPGVVEREINGNDDEILDENFLEEIRWGGRWDTFSFQRNDEDNEGEERSGSGLQSLLNLAMNVNFSFSVMTDLTGSIIGTDTEVPSIGLSKKAIEQLPTLTYHEYYSKRRKASLEANGDKILNGLDHCEDHNKEVSGNAMSTLLPKGEEKGILSFSGSSLNRSISDESFVNTGCSICLSTFQEDDILIVLPCDSVTEKHSFHKQCIEKWLLHHKTCPLCNKVIEEQ